MTAWDALVDLRRRTVSPQVFTDAGVYQAEQERSFVGCWLYVAHASAIPRPGDCVINYMGAEPVIVCGDARGRVRAFSSSCRHRGRRVCRLNAGNARTFPCPYHDYSCALLIGTSVRKESRYH